MIVRGEILIDRPRDQVFELVALRLFETYHLWNTGVTDVRPLTLGPVQQGSRGVAVEFVRRGRGRYVEEGTAFEVVRLVDGQELVLDESDAHPVLERSRTTLQFEARGARTLVRAAKELVWGLDWLGFVLPFFWIRHLAELRRNLRRLRAALQARELPPAPRRPPGI